MMATISQRLEKLEVMAKANEPELILILAQRAGTEATDTVTGFRLEDGRRVARQPNESLEALKERAAAMSQSGGLVILFAEYARTEVLEN